MIHHVSYVVRDPQHVAAAIARILRVSMLKAPSPPFPSGSWFVVALDAYGTLVEFLPWGTVYDDASDALGHDEHMRPKSGSHVLMSSPRTADEILTIARESDWRARVVETGLFEFVKVWIENTTVIEFLTPEQWPRYVSHFGLPGRTELPMKLQALEDDLRQAATRRAMSIVSG